MLDARLAKVRQRKMKKLKGDGAEEELDVADNEGSTFQNGIAQLKVIIANIILSLILNGEFR